MSMISKRSVTEMYSFIVWNSVPLNCSGWLWTHIAVVQADFKLLMIFFPQPQSSLWVYIIWPDLCLFIIKTVYLLVVSTVPPGSSARGGLTRALTSLRSSTSLYFLLIWLRLSLWSPDWPWTQGSSPASAFQVLGLQIYSIIIPLERHSAFFLP